MTDLLNLLNTLVPASLPKSKYYIEKQLHSQVKTIEYDFYCQKCQCLFGPAPQLDSCPDCDTAFVKEDSLKEGSFTLCMPLGFQIRRLFEDHNICDNLKTDRTSN